MKYIDAEKLKSVIKTQINERKNWMKDIDKSARQDQLWSDLNEEDMSILQIISSLQQEQPEPSNNLVDVDAVREDFMTEVYRVLDADPTNDRANAIINAFDSLPTVYQEQPEVDLEKEIDDWYNAMGIPVTADALKETARHFYELGLNARKED